jgi:hypothetical protein
MLTKVRVLGSDVKIHFVWNFPRFQVLV